jgi:hypothetical protein
MDAAEPSWERAFVAMSYFLGERADALAPFELGPEARLLATALSHHDQKHRVAALAVEVARIAVALEQGIIE